MSFYDRNGLLHLRTGGPYDTENFPVYTITNYFLTKRKQWTPKGFDKLIDNHTNSWENMLAMSIYCAIEDPEALETYDIFRPQRYLSKHPRCWLWLFYIRQTPLLKWIAIPFLLLIFSSTLLFHSERDKSLDWPARQPKTDTEPLLVLMCLLPKKYKFIHWFKPFILWRVTSRFGKFYFQNMMQIHYQDYANPHVLHPNIIASKHGVLEKRIKNETIPK